MRLPIIDDGAQFVCTNCTACCNQPWRTLIEADLAGALDAHDFSAYPQLEGRQFYRPIQEEGYHELAKGEGTRCLFLDTDNLCIIHKELGVDAKPTMCRKFPYVWASADGDDRLSVNYGCPAVQNREGPALPEQTEEVAAVFKPSQTNGGPAGQVALDGQCRLTRSQADALLERADALFDSGRVDDIWSRFARLLALLSAVGEHQRLAQRSDADPRMLDALLQPGGALPTAPEAIDVRSYARPVEAPMPSRFLFAATLFKDTVPPEGLARGGFWTKLAIAPKLFALASMSGSYASRLLKRNISVRDTWEYEVGPRLPDAATDLLTRYYRSRLWQRFLVGTRLSILGGVHQHIQDLNAIIFYAKAEARRLGAADLDAALIRHGLRVVEFHLANQHRFFDHFLKGWTRAQLNNVALARSSLRLMSLNPAAAPTPVGVSD